MGGLPRRNHIVIEQRAERPTVSVDAGGSLVKRPKGPIPNLPEARAKAAVIAESLALAGTDAMALSPSDWQLGAELVRGLVEAHDLPVLAGNLLCDGERPYPGHRLVERGDLTLGFVGFTAGEVTGCTAESAVPAMQAAVAAVADADVVIAVLPSDDRATRQVLEAVPGIDLAFDAHPTRMVDEPDEVGGAWLIGSGSRGQRVGLTTIAFHPDGEAFAPQGWAAALERDLAAAKRRVATIADRIPTAEPRVARVLERTLESSKEDVERIEARLVVADDGTPRHGISVEYIELDDAIDDHEPTARVVAAFNDALASGQLAALPETSDRRIATGSTAFAGSDTCAGCHPAQTEDWSETAHAHAWQTLVDAGKVASSDCYSCHVTGADHPDGPQHPVEVGGLRDVQCEACHGPSRAHADDPQGTKPIASPGEAVCTGCHDGVNDQGQFDLSTYLPRVDHK